MREAFRKFAHQCAESVGSPVAFTAGLLIIVLWGMSGPLFHYSDTWQLVINTGTTIITFLMVFLIQNTQNRDSKMLHLKLDELLRAIKPARTELVGMEDLSDDDLNRLHDEFKALYHTTHEKLTRIEEARKIREKQAAERAENLT